MDSGTAELHEVSEGIWEIPASAQADMRVPARLFADRELLGEIQSDQSLDQLQNVATLPGVTGAALAMPTCTRTTASPSGESPRPSPPTG